MADLSIDFCGVKSPNPFWLASAPPTNTGDQVSRAFDAGWGGAVWKTLGNPIVNVSSRFGGIDYGNQKLVGLNNIELITGRLTRNVLIAKAPRTPKIKFQPWRPWRLGGC
jgi:dihydropyrimidine dehydrogenase (NAD+) subunit PreA